jgi:hypothetical protein
MIRTKIGRFLFRLDDWIEDGMDGPVLVSLFRIMVAVVFVMIPGIVLLAFTAGAFYYSLWLILRGIWRLVFGGLW